jgi:hypothetical protein
VTYYDDPYPVGDDANRQMTDIPPAEQSPTTAAERLYRHLCEAYTARDLAAVLKDYDDALAEARATPPAAALDASSHVRRHDTHTRPCATMIEEGPAARLSTTEATE